jgi:hypothetical protein
MAIGFNELLEIYHVRGFLVCWLFFPPKCSEMSAGRWCTQQHDLETAEILVLVP